MQSIICTISQMWIAIFQPLQIYTLVTQPQVFMNLKLHCWQWSRLFMCWNRYLHSFCLDILWSVNSWYWQRSFLASQLQCRYEWLVYKWKWKSCITHCQYTESVVSVNQFYAHYRESSLCDVRCYCCRRIRSACWSLLLWKVTVQIWLCRRPQLGTLQVLDTLLRQSFDQWPGLRQFN